MHVNFPIYLRLIGKRIIGRRRRKIGPTNRRLVIRRHYWRRLTIRNHLREMLVVSTMLLRRDSLTPGTINPFSIVRPMPLRWVAAHIVFCVGSDGSNQPLWIISLVYVTKEAFRTFNFFLRHLLNKNVIKTSFDDVLSVILSVNWRRHIPSLVIQIIG